jgi:hypothetical protein
MRPKASTDTLNLWVHAELLSAWRTMLGLAIGFCQEQRARLEAAVLREGSLLFF